MSCVSYLEYFLSQSFLKHSKNSIYLDFDRKKHSHTPNSRYPNTAYIKRRSNIRGFPIMMIWILNQT